MKNFVLRLQRTDKYICNIVRQSDTQELTPVDYTRLRGEAFVFPCELANDKSLKGLHISHIIEEVDREANFVPRQRTCESCIKFQETCSRVIIDNLCFQYQEEDDRAMLMMEDGEMELPEEVLSHKEVEAILKEQADHPERFEIGVLA